MILSLASCRNIICINDKLSVLPITSSGCDEVEPVENNKSKEKLDHIKKELSDTPTGAVISTTRTLCQANALMRFIEVLTDKNLESTVVMTAARGRGKSATLGLAIAAALSLGYSNIFITAPSPENLKTVFEFLKKGLDLLKYDEGTDYNFIQSTNDLYNKAIVRVKLFRDHNQVVQYIHPSDHKMLAHCEIMVIDEAAAIPLPLVRKLLGNH